MNALSISGFALLRLVQAVLALAQADLSKPDGGVPPASTSPTPANKMRHADNARLERRINSWASRCFWRRNPRRNRHVAKFNVPRRPLEPGAAAIAQGFHQGCPQRRIGADHFDIHAIS